MKKLIINLVLAGIVISTVSACNSGSGDSYNEKTPVQAPQAEEPVIEQKSSEANVLISIPSISRVSVTHQLDIENIDTWWKGKQAEAKAGDNAAKAKTNLLAAVTQDKFGVYFKTQVSNLLMSGLNFGANYALGIVQNAIMKSIFPGYPGKSIEEIRFDRIMETLERIDTKLSEVRAIGQDTFSTLVSNNFDDKQNVYASIVANIKNEQANVASALDSVKSPSRSFGADYISGKFDFMTEVDGKMVTNESAVKLILYLADQKSNNGKTVFSDIFSEYNAAALEKYAQELSNLSSVDAYTAPVKAMKNIRTSIDVNNLNLIPNLMSALSAKVYDNYNSAWTKTTEQVYSYDKTKYRVIHSNNQLMAYPAFDSLLQAMDVDIMKNLIVIEKMQYISLSLYYLGNDKTIAIPSFIKSNLFIDEINAEKAEAKGDTMDAALIRQALFERATQMLSDSYERRAKHVSELIFTPATQTYGKFMFNSVSPVGDDEVFSPSWDLIRGAGIYANESAGVIHPVKSESEDYTVYYNTYADKDKTHSKKSIVELIRDDDIYWDGKYLKTPNLSSSKELLLDRPLMQKIGSICNPEDGVYKLQLTTNNLRYYNLLYCPVDTLNFSLLKGLMQPARQDVLIDLVADNKWRDDFDKDGFTLGVKPGEFYTADGKLHVSDSVKYFSTTDKWDYSYKVSRDKFILTPYSSVRRLRIDMPGLNSAINASIKASSVLPHQAYFPINSKYGQYFVVAEPEVSTSTAGTAVLTGDFYMKNTKENLTPYGDHLDGNVVTYDNYPVIVFARNYSSMGGTKRSRHFVLGYNPVKGNSTFHPEASFYRSNRTDD